MCGGSTSGSTRGREGGRPAAGNGLARPAEALIPRVVGRRGGASPSALTPCPRAAKEPLFSSGLTLSSPNLLHAIAQLIPLLLSLTVHECAHAWSAYRLGDDTAARMGRLTLNPVPHIDPFGTILLPLALMLSNTGFMFGWAKPVPVDPTRFRRSVRMGPGMAWTAAAGPLSNVLLAVLAAVVLGGFFRFSPESVRIGTGVRELLVGLLQVNVALALFNLIPVPPLDGSRIVDGYMPLRLRPVWDRVTAFSPFLLMGVFFFGGRIIAGPFAYLFGLLADLVNFIGAA